MKCKICGEETGSKAVLCDACRYPKPGYKRCTYCLKVKPLSDFFKKKGSKDGYESLCKECKAKFKIESEKKVKWVKQSEIKLTPEQVYRIIRRLALEQLLRVKRDYTLDEKTAIEFIKDKEFVDIYCNLAGIPTAQYFSMLMSEQS